MAPYVLIFLLLWTHLDAASLSINEHQRFKQLLGGEGLYSSDDDVEVLTVDNFKSTVMGSTRGHIVEFYNSWCGFCQRFAPSWKALATDVRGWGDLVKVAALDCSVDLNAPICREYEIMAYPTLRYFHEGYVAGPQNLGVAVQKGDDVEAHKRYLIDRLIAEQYENRGAQFPVLKPYVLESGFEGLPSEVEWLFLVFEKQASYLGEQVAMDLHKTHNIRIRYVLDNNTQLMEKYSVKILPTVIVLSRSNQYQVLNTTDSRDEVKKTIRQYLESKHVKVTDETPTDEIFKGRWLEVNVPDMSQLIKERAQQALKERIKKMGDVIFQMDLETTLRYSLKHEISSIKTFSEEKLQVLRSFLQLLKKYFPFGHNGQLFLTELIVKASQSEVTGTEIADIVKKAEKEESLVFSSSQQFLACQGSKSSFRGYPCGLWTLFHFMTVNSADRGGSNPLEVLNVMRGYIKNFFGCHDCAQHFLEMSVRRQMDNITSANSAVLWLWMAHNEVNKRLSGDQTEDPEHPKVQFPTKERCPDCRDSKGNWELEKVLKYLNNVYSTINIRYLGSDTSVLHQGLDRGSLNTSSGGGGGIFQPLDLSMCFILYVCCFFLLALLIRLFLKRGYRKKVYVHDLLGKV